MGSYFRGPAGGGALPPNRGGATATGQFSDRSLFPESLPESLGALPDQFWQVVLDSEASEFGGSVASEHGNLDSARAGGTLAQGER